MSAPVLWIALPLLFAGLLMIVNNSRFVFLVSCLSTLFLTLAAWLLPIDTDFVIGRLTFKLLPSVSILGRNFTLTSADRSFLALIFGSTFFWFIPADSLKISKRLIPLGLAITALLVGAISVKPFLYAALIIEMAVLLSVPMLAAPKDKPIKGVIRFLILQTLAVPFLLFSGWLLAGIGANPGNLSLVQQASIFLGLGFAFLLAIFPFYTWIPLLAEKAHPYLAGFLFWILPTISLFWGLGFLDQYSWLRNATFLPAILTFAGVLMIISGGLLAAFQHHLGRIMGYATIIETGFSLLALSMVNQLGLKIFFLLLVPRTLSLGLWSVTLTILREHAPGLTLEEVKGMGRKWPFATSGLILANLALAGMPSLAGFPPHQAIWEGLAHNSLSLALWVLIGNLGLVTSAIRVLAAITAAPEGFNWGIRETQSQRILIIFGLLGLFILGLFPQWALPLWTKLPAIFEHLGL